MKSEIIRFLHVFVLRPLRSGPVLLKIRPDKLLKPKKHCILWHHSNQTKTCIRQKIMNDLSKFQIFEVKNLKAIKGGDGEEPDPNGVIGSDDIADA